MMLGGQTRNKRTSFSPIKGTVATTFDCTALKKKSHGFNVSTFTALPVSKDSAAVVLVRV